MFENENYKSHQNFEAEMMSKWAPVLNKVGVTDEQKMRTTAILLENYLHHLEETEGIIAEEAVQSNAFKGVHLALLGLISRTIPGLIATDFIGVQAMPSPRAPIFTARWHKSTSKGATTKGDELFVGGKPAGEFEMDPSGWVDPYYTSNLIRGEATGITGATGSTLDSVDLVFGNKMNLMGKDKNGDAMFGRPFIFANTMRVALVGDEDKIVAQTMIKGGYTQTTDAFPLGSGTVQLVVDPVSGKKSIEASAAFSGLMTGATKLVLEYDYDGEFEGNMSEIGMTISETSIDLIRRQLRGKFTVDAAYDLNVLHGINLENEITSMMKQELMAEINREVINDLEKLAQNNEIFDYAKFSPADQVPSIHGNYNDAHLALLDAINLMAAKIQVEGRLGKGNFVIVNPETLTFLERTPGFMGGGGNYNGRDISFSGSLAGKIKVYSDPYFKKNKILIGYKGSGSLETGYMHCPYLPITATPNILNPETGDPSKIFYTRYGKTYALDKNPDSDKYGSYKNHILMGERQYATLSLKSYPNILGS